MTKRETSPKGTETIEKKVADTVLETADTIKVGDREYRIAPPTAGTLIMVSSLASTLPIVHKDTNNALYEVLATAKESEVIGRIAAVLILGAKRVKEHHRITVPITECVKRWSWRKFSREWAEKKTDIEVLETDYLADCLLEDMTVKELNDIIVKRLGGSQFGDFFVLTTSLSEVNLLRRTREAETASGV